jgi:selenocysteine lyase/cysteine desulfurase
MTGTQNHEGIAGVRAAVEYLADLGREVTGDSDLQRRPALAAAYDAIAGYEQRLVLQLLAGLAETPAWTVHGVTDPSRLAERMPTVSITHDQLPAAEIARRLGARGIFAWHGNYYAVGVTEALGLEPEGMVRLGLVHYNTEEEVARTLEALRTIE